VPKPSSSRSSVSIEIPLVTDIDRHRLDTSHSYYRASIQRRAVKNGRGLELEDQDFVHLNMLVILVVFL